jgi:hypothetical protein
VSNMDSDVDAYSLSMKLAEEWPPCEYPVHIQVVGHVGGGGVSVHVWNSRGIKESGIVYREDHAGSDDPISVAVVEEIEYIVNGLVMEGKLPNKCP